MVTSRRTGTNENIQTFGDGTRDFTSLSTWESATDNDLVTATQSEVLECYADAASYNLNLTFSGATTSALYFRIVRAAAGEAHDGTRNSGVFFDRSANVNLFSLNENYAQVQDIVARLTANSGGSLTTFRARNTGNLFVGCISAGSTNTGAGVARGFDTAASPTGAGFVDCLAENSEDDGFFLSGTLSGNFLYNCTSVDSGNEGFDLSGAGTLVKNCLASGNTSAGFSGTISGSSITNASDDATAPGSSPRINQTFTFVNAAGNDYHLSLSDAGALDFGTDLSGDATFDFDDDIDGDTIAVWSIGIDSPGSGGAAVAPLATYSYRRRRVS